jgi:hypothetical protein
MAKQEVAIPMSCYIVPQDTTRSMLHTQPLAFILTVMNEGAAFGSVVLRFHGVYMREKFLQKPANIS